MIEIMRNLPEGIIGVEAKGEVTREDYEKVLIPELEIQISRHGKVAFLYYIGSDFQRFTVGAMWDDFKAGLSHLSSWRKIAIVTDVEWIRRASDLFRFLFPCEVRSFQSSSLSEAKHWISEDPALSNSDK